MRDERVSRDPRVDFRLSPVAELHVEVRSHVLAPAVGLRLDQRRALAPSRTGDGLLGRLVDRHDVVPIDRDPLHLVGGAPRDLRAQLSSRKRRVRRVAVVFAHEEHGQPPERRERQALVHDALLHRRVAEEGDGHRVAAFHPRGHRAADRERNTSRDDRRGAEHSHLRRGEMHRSALAPAASRRLPVELREHPAQRAALGEVVGVTAMAAEGGVRAVEHGTDAGRHRLLADGQMRRASDLLLGIEPDDRLLGLPDAQHRHVQHFERLRSEPVDPSAVRPAAPPGGGHLRRPSGGARDGQPSRSFRRHTRESPLYREVV